MSVGLTIIGLGTGDVEQLTVQAFKALERADQIVVASPDAADLVHRANSALSVELLDVESIPGLVLRLLALGRRPEGAIYATLGNPAIDDVAAQDLIDAIPDLDVPVQVLPGVSLLDADIALLGLDPSEGLQICDAAILASRRHPPLDPDVGALITNLRPDLAQDAVATLLNQYHDDHPVLLSDTGHAVDLCDLPSLITGFDVTAYLPPLDRPGSLSTYQDVMAQLRAPDGCPWDAEQTHASLRTHLLEETYEVLGALDAGDTDGLREELGDLLLQILFHAQIAVEEGEFKLIDTIQYVVAKLIRRHPHVFGDTRVDGAGEVLVNWEQIKREERRQNGGENEFKSMLSGLNRALPSLSRAIEVQKRVARVGFDWPDVAPVRAKVDEEMAEFEAAEDPDERTAEFGDLVFALVNLARWHKIDAESALRQAVDKFERRFEVIERHAANNGVPLEAMTLKEMDAIWESAKAQERDA